MITEETRVPNFRRCVGIAPNGQRVTGYVETVVGNKYRVRSEFTGRYIDVTPDNLLTPHYHDDHLYVDPATV